jgi:hypothetical protein
MKLGALAIAAVAGAGSAAGQDIGYRAEAFNTAHAGLARSAGLPAQLANEEYVEALARLVYYWAYPAIDVTSRTSMWEMMEDGPGLMFGIGPGAPENASGCLADYLPPAQRIIVTPNNDTFYGVAFLDLGAEPVVVQTPEDVPEGHYWVMQIADVFTNVDRTLGSALGTKPGKYLLVGPDWQGEKPAGFEEVIRLSTNYGGVFPRSFAARTPEARERAIAVSNQMGFWSLTMYDKDYFMLADAPDGRTNLGTVNLDADQLSFADDGSLTLVMSHAEPTDPGERANWLPAPEGQFALIICAYVPEQPILDDSYSLPNVVRR